MILQERDAATCRWQGALIMVLGWLNPGEWTNLREAQEKASAFARSRWDDRPDLALKTQSNLKRILVQQELIEQRQTGGHYQLRLTDRGEAAFEEIDGNEDWGTLDSPSIMKSAIADGANAASLYGRRIGKNHKLGRDMWGLMMKQIDAGLMDLIMIPSATKTKAKYWDEA